jgi:predicted patatin/cPLA2 family phospholipase
MDLEINAVESIEVTDSAEIRIKQKKIFRILSIDGGGIKGLLPATVLTELEKPLVNYFDLICGASTGAIIALAIAVKKQAAVIKDLYENNAEKIFKKKTLFNLPYRGLKLTCGDGGIYNSSVLEQLLKKEFVDEQKKHYLMKDAKTILCIPAINLTTGNVVVFKSPHMVELPRKEELTGDENNEMYKVAMASCAAPLYFKTMELKDSFYIDGGLWANNPSLIGIVEAIRCGFNLKEIQILSLGTGSYVFQKPQGVAKKMNLFNWDNCGLELVDVSFEVQAQSVHNEIKCLFPDKYLRIQHTFHEKLAMDDTRRLGDLKAAGQELFKKRGNEIRSFLIPKD